MDISTKAAERPVITAREVASMLGYRCRTTFDAKRRSLEQKHLFPPKLPGVNGWSRAAVMRWIETNGRTYLPDMPETTIAVDANALEARYAR